jgi:hypothetical protein
LTYPKSSPLTDYYKVIILLLDRGGDTNLLNNKNQTPLMFASTTILQKLGMQGGVCSVTRNLKSFDNRRIAKPVDPHKDDDFLVF